MDIYLLKKIAQYVKGQMEAPQHIQGYSDGDVKGAVDDMFSKGVLEFGKAMKLQPKDGNYRVTTGSNIPIKGGVTIDVLYLHESEFEKCYGDKWY